MSGRRRRKSKIDLMIHAQRRFQERLGINLSDEDYLRLVNKIKRYSESGRTDGEVLHLGRQSYSRSIYLVKFNDDVFICPYNRKLGAIATVLTEQMLFEYLSVDWQFCEDATILHGKKFLRRLRAALECVSRGIKPPPNQYSFKEVVEMAMVRKDIILDGYNGRVKHGGKRG